MAILSGALPTINVEELGIGVVVSDELPPPPQEHNTIMETVKDTTAQVFLINPSLN
jgi:hypothetical protein